MAIVLIRVDQRLLHGQVVEAWIPHLRVDRVWVADDDLARDPLARLTATAACPSKVKVAITSLDEFVRATPELQTGPDRTLVIVSSVAALERAWRAGALAGGVNVGNVARAAERVTVTPSVALSPLEVAALDAIASTGAAVEARAVPREKSVDLEGIRAAVRRRDS